MPSFINSVYPDPTSTLAIPLVDISPFTSLTSHPSARLSSARALLHAFRTSGFLYLTSHPISSTSISTTFALSSQFFAQSQQLKDSLAWYSPEANRGYSGMGLEKVSQGDKSAVEATREEEGQDLKESIEIGRDDEGPGRHNMWPPVSSWALAIDFKNHMLAFHAECKALHQTLMRMLALSLELDEGYFDEYTAVGDNTLRLLHYPEQEREVFARKKGQVRAGAHSDYGSLTLLFQDERGGLQVKDGEGEWRDVTPVQGAIVVNAGDLLARWSSECARC